MNTTTRLDQLRQESPACRAVGYADIASGTILATSADPVLSQEKWDDLCAMAEDLLQGGSAQVAQDCLGQSAGLDFAALIAGTDHAVCVASPDEADCAICALCQPGVDLSHFADAARRVLSEIAADV